MNEEPKPREVPLWAPFVALLAVLIIVSITGAAVFGVVSATDPAIEHTDDLPDGYTMGLTFFQDLVFVFGAWVAVKLALGTAPRERFGLVWPRNLTTALKWAALAYVAFWVVATVLALLFGEPDDQDLVTDLKSEDALGTLLLWALLICIVAPIVEEFFFRGFMFTVFRRRLGIAWALVLDGLIFGLGHAPAAPIQLIALGVFGVGLCVLYWRTQSIIPCMALHALNNSITYGVTKELDAGLFALLVVGSVGAVVALATSVSARRTVLA